MERRDKLTLIIKNVTCNECGNKKEHLIEFNFSTDGYDADAFVLCESCLEEASKKLKDMCI